MRFLWFYVTCWLRYDKNNYFTDLVRYRITNCKVRDKVIVDALMAYGGLEEELLSFLTMIMGGSDWLDSPPGKGFLYSLNRRLSGPQRRSGRF